MKLYAISKIFYSPQNERVHESCRRCSSGSGHALPNPTRDSACSTWDNVIPLRDRMTANEVAKPARICNFGCKCVVLTSCEPEAQLDAGLVGALHAVGFSIAAETANPGPRITDYCRRDRQECAGGDNSNL
jgi:hypothetical protein